MKSNTNTSPLIMSKVITVLSLALLGATYSGLASAACTTDLDLGGQNITNIGTLSGASGASGSTLTLTIGSNTDAGGNSITTTGAVNAGTVTVGTANNTYTLPANRGTNGQVLTTDGAGATSWQTSDLETIVFTTAPADFTAIASTAATGGFTHNFNSLLGGTNPSVRVFRAIVTSYAAANTRSASVDFAVKNSPNQANFGGNACSAHNTSGNAAGYTQTSLTTLAVAVVDANGDSEVACRFRATNLHTNDLFFSFGIYAYGT